MAKYRVKKSFRGSPDGAHVYAYEKGDEVDLTGDLEKIALAEKWVYKQRETAGSRNAGSGDSK